MTVKMKFYNKVNPKLDQFINHYWTTEGDLENKNSFKILPMDHIDVVIQLTGERVFFYENNQLQSKSNIYFHGMRDQPVSIIQTGHVACMGISFKPWGFYHFSKQALIESFNKTINFECVNEALAKQLKNLTKNISNTTSEAKIQAVFTHIEACLIKELSKITHPEDYLSHMIKACEDEDGNLEAIAQELNISVRTLERLFKKYIGISPKLFFKVRQFEEASRSVLYKGDQKFTDIAYDGNYYDQAHFSRVFKQLSNETPKSIRQEKSAIKSQMTFE